MSNIYHSNNEISRELRQHRFDEAAKSFREDSALLSNHDFNRLVHRVQVQTHNQLHALFDKHGNVTHLDFGQQSIFDKHQATAHILRPKHSDSRHENSRLDDSVQPLQQSALKQKNSTSKDSRQPNSNGSNLGDTTSEHPEAKVQPAEENGQTGCPDYRGTSGHASIRNNNPGAMYPGESARKFGSAVTHCIGGGHLIAEFPDAVSGAAAQFDLLHRHYYNMRVRDAIDKWCGHNSVDSYRERLRNSGVDLNATVGETLQQKDKAIALASAMARVEAGTDYPLSQEQWSGSFDKYAANPPGSQYENLGDMDGKGSPNSGNPNYYVSEHHRQHNIKHYAANHAHHAHGSHSHYA